MSIKRTRIVVTPDSIGGFDVYARGRNGSFTPREINVLSTESGVKSIYVDSRRSNNNSPIVLGLLPKDADQLGRALLTVPEPSFFEGLFLVHYCIHDGEYEYGDQFFIRAVDIEDATKKAWESLHYDNCPDEDDREKPYTEFLDNEVVSNGNFLEYDGDYRRYVVEHIHQISSWGDLIDYLHIPQLEKEPENAGAGTKR